MCVCTCDGFQNAFAVVTCGLKEVDINTTLDVKGG